MLLVDAVECFAVERDLDSELDAAIAVPPVQVLELAPCGDELPGAALALPLEPLLLLAHQPEDGVAPLGALVERERFGGGAFEGAGRALGWCGRVGPAQGCLAFERVAIGEVEPRLKAGAGAGDVAPLLERALVVQEDEGAVDGGAPVRRGR